MKYFVLTYDPSAKSEPLVQEFDEDGQAFLELESQTLANLGREGVEVVLFYCESEAALRSANHRYFSPEVSERLLENIEGIRNGAQRIQHRIFESVPSYSA